MSRSFINGCMSSILLAQDEQRFYKSYIHEYVEQFIWLIALVTCYYYWITGNEEINTSFTVLNQLVFITASMLLLFLQKQINLVSGTNVKKAQFYAIGVNLMFVFLGHFFCYYMFGLACLCLISINFRLFSRHWVWTYSLVLPILSGFYDVYFKEIPFYADTKFLFTALNLMMLTLCEKTLAERKSHDKANRLIKELRATRLMLEQSAKRNERLRISRDLHDSTGHYLTSMNMQLELALISKDEAARESVITAKHLGGLLYKELRKSVQEYRTFNNQDLENSILELTKNIPGLIIETKLDLKKNQMSNNHAEVVFRCVQECLTNTIRHSNASSAFILLSSSGKNIEISYRDNGSSGSGLVLGNGLTGLRERIERIGGQLTLGLSKSGFELEAVIERESLFSEQFGINS